jgi:hypothetical protein
MRRLKQRRGAFVVMTGIMFLALVICGAVAIDFNRLWTERWELQTAADAGAIAGAMQLLPPRDSLQYDPLARKYVGLNRALSDSITVDSVIKGNWDGPTRVFTPAGSPSNAVRVVVSQDPRNLFMEGFGVPVPRMYARSIAWAGAPVATTPACMKPWAIPYEELMYRINLYRNIVPANSNANLTRPFDQVHDLAALQAMSAADRTFSLKLGNGKASGTYVPGSGNFQAIKLPKFYDYATNTGVAPNSIPGGANVYGKHINGENPCVGLAVGDSVVSEGGVMSGPTISGMCDYSGNRSGTVACTQPSLCASVVIPLSKDYADCRDSQGNFGVDVKSAFFSCKTGCTGRSEYRVDLLGSFTIRRVYLNNPAAPHDKAEIEGEFKPVQATGGAGGGSTTLVKLLLVQ